MTSRELVIPEQPSQFPQLRRYREQTGSPERDCVAPRLVGRSRVEAYPVAWQRYWRRVGEDEKIYGFCIDSDPKQRASHPKWVCCWMTLWAAAIEAIARAWKVPLQEVLDASEIASNAYDQSVDEKGRTLIRPSTDTIRNPRASDTD